MGEAYLKPGFRATRRPYRNEPSRPATLHDVVCDLGEFMGDGVARTAGGFRYEPLDWSRLKNRRSDIKNTVAA